MGLFVESGSEKYIKLCMRLFCFSLFVCKSKSEKKQEMTLVGILLGNQNICGLFLDKLEGCKLVLTLTKRKWAGIPFHFTPHLKEVIV